MKHVFIVCLFLLSFPFIGLSQCPPNSENVTLLYNFDDDGVATLYGDSFNDCWGYTDASGNEYAILGGIDSIYVFDITIPESSYKVDADFINQNSLWRDFKTYDHYLYAVSDQPGTTTGLLVYDLDSLSSGKLHRINNYNNIFNRAHNIFIDETTKKLYVAGSNSGAASEGVLIYDLSTDAFAQNPSLIKAVNFDTLIGNPALSTYIHDIFVRNDTAYCSHGYTGYYIWDLTNPTSLDASAYIGSMDNSTSTMGGYVHSSWNTPNNNYAIMAVEVNGSFPDKRKLFVIDQNNMNAPVLETSWKEPLLACVGELNNVPHNPMLRGDTMFVSYYHDGIQILDFSDPTNPQRIGYYDTDTTNTSYPGYSGAWGIYPFFPSGNFIGSDMHEGLFVFKYEDFCPSPPEIDPISDITSCDFYILPPISGNNLTGNQAYYDGPAGTGNMYLEGSSIVTSGTYYAYDGVVGCADEEPFDLVIFSSPSADAGSNVSICNGDTTTISAEGSGGNPPYTYTWNQGLGDGQSHNVFPSSSTNYTVTVSDANGCSDTDVVTVIVHQNPVADAGQDESICTGSSIIISASATGGNAPYTYFWDNGLGAGQSHMVSPVINTTYSVTVTDANGCSNTDAVIITVNENPTVNAGADQVICSGVSASLYAEGSGGSSPYTYTWDNGLGDGQSQTVSPEVNTIYEVTITDANGCTAADQLEITVFTSPAAEAGVDTALCSGESTTLTANASGGMAPYTYSWDNDLGGGQSHVVNPVVSTLYSVTVTDAIGCSDVDQVMVTVYEPPVAEIQGLNLLCEGQSQELDAGDGFTEYSWSTGETSQKILVSNAGIYSVTVSDINGCTADDNLELIVVDSLFPEITGALSFCFGQNTSLVAGEGYGSYAWNTGENTQSIIVDQAGTYAVTVTNAIGCEGSSEVFVQEFPAPQALTGMDNVICFGESTFVEANASGGSAPYNYTWDNGLGNGQMHLVAPAVTTSYTVTVSDVLGCTDTAQQTISVFGEINTETGDVVQICLGNSIEISVEANGGTAPYNYTWDNGLGDGQTHVVDPDSSTTYMVTVTDANGCNSLDSVYVEVLPALQPEITGNAVLCENSSTLLDAGDGYSSYTWNNGDSTQSTDVDTPGIYSVTVTNEQGCAGTADFVVTQNPVPMIQISPDQSICDGTGTEISAEVNDSSGTYNYTWDQGLGEGSSHFVSPQNNTIYTVTITDENACNYIDSVLISVFENPSVMAVEDSQICFGDSISIYCETTGGAAPYVYLWDQELGGGAMHVVAPDTSTLYSVISFDQNGCQSSDSVLINVFPAIDLEISGDTFLCNGLSSELDAGEGYSSYAWNTGDTSQTIIVLEEGEYSITVRDENNCEETAAVLVSFVDSLEVSISGTLHICVGDSTTLDAGEGYSSYAWNTGDTSQAILVNETGMFSVSVTNSSGCTGHAAVNTQLVPNPELSATEDQSICEGESTVVSATTTGGSFPIGFIWDNGLGEGDTHEVSPDTTTTYMVTVYDSFNCSDAGMTTVFVNPMPDTIVSLNAPDELIAEQENALYQWLICDNDFEPVEGANEQSFIPAFSGAYAVEIDLNGCVDTSVCTQIILSDLFELETADYKIYPVPTSDFVQIISEHALHGLSYKIYNLDGQLLAMDMLNSEGRLSLAEYLPGMYLLELNGRLFKLVKM